MDHINPIGNKPWSKAEHARYHAEWKTGHTGTDDGSKPCALGDKCEAGGRHTAINARFWNYRAHKAKGVRS